MPKKYREKPEVVEVMKIEHGVTLTADVERFAGVKLDLKTIQECKLFTPEGYVSLEDGGYIVKDCQGHLTGYSVVDFEATYEPVSAIPFLTTNVNFANTDIDIDKIIDKFAKRLEEELTRSL